VSLKHAKDFLVKIATDAEAAERARLAHEASLLAVAKELGYDLNASDLEAAMAEIVEIDELSDEELDQVAGGLPSLSTPLVRPQLGSLGSALFGFGRLRFPMARLGGLFADTLV
jgi:predicted ribosomally synthesized peptide with nif11-like leader